jgi:hypothetical protein
MSSFSLQKMIKKACIRRTEKPIFDLASFLPKSEKMERGMGRIDSEIQVGENQ